MPSERILEILAGGVTPRRRKSSRHLAGSRPPPDRAQTRVTGPRNACVPRPEVPGEAAVRAYDSMAGDRHRKRVRGACLSDGPSCLGLANRVGLRVGHRLAGGDLRERLPHALLERSATNVERQLRGGPGLLDEADHLGHEVFARGISTDELCAREAALEIVGQLLRIVAEKDRTHTTLGGRYHWLPTWCSRPAMRPGPRSCLARPRPR